MMEWLSKPEKEFLEKVFEIIDTRFVDIEVSDTETDHVWCVTITYPMYEADAYGVLLKRFGSHLKQIYDSITKSLGKEPEEEEYEYTTLPF